MHTKKQAYGHLAYMHSEIQYYVRVGNITPRGKITSVNAPRSVGRWHHRHDALTRQGLARAPPL